MLTPPKLILIIDDDIDDIDILKELIHDIDDKVICIGQTDPVAGMTAIQDFLPNYIFLDINMPKMTGDVLLKLFRSKEELKSTVIAIMSTSMDEDFAHRLVRNGANYAFEKPANIELLSSTLRKILNHD